MPPFPRSLRLLSCLLLAFVAALAGSAADQTQQLYEQARAKFAAKNVSGALADLDAGLKIAPTDERLLIARAAVRISSGNDSGALIDLSQVLIRNGANAEARALRADLYDRKAIWTLAATDLDELIRLTPAQADPYARRSLVRLRQMDFPAAVADARQARTRDPKSAHAMRALGYALFAQGEYAEAAKSLEQAAKAEPADQAYPLMVRHFALQRSGVADDRLAKAWGSWPGDPWSQVLAQFITGKLTEEQLDKIVTDTADVVERVGLRCEAHFYIGLARLQAGDVPAARLRFQRVRETGKKTYIEYALAEAELKRR